MKLLHQYNGTQHVPSVVGNEGDTAMADWMKDVVNGLAIADNTLEDFKKEIDDLSDLLGMTDDDVDAVRTSLSTAERNYRGNSGSTHKLTARTCRRLKGLVKLVNYLSLVRRNATLADIQWTKIQTFLVEWEALVTLTKALPPQVPRYQANKGMPKHMQSMFEFFGRVYGNQFCPVTYLLCEDVLRDESSPEDAKPFLPGRYYCEDHVRIVDEIHARAPRDTPTAQADNELIYKYMADSLTGTSAAPVLQEFERTRDGRGLWQRTLETQCSSTVQRHIAENHLKYLQTCFWLGEMDLATFIDKLRQQYRCYVEAAEKGGMQLYEDNTRVSWMLRSLSKFNDTTLAIRIEHVKDDPKYMNDFENAAQHLAKTEYAGKGKKGKKRVTIKEGEVSGVDGKDVILPNGKKHKSGARGQKTGVLLKWYDDSDFAKLKPAEKKELAEWRKTNNIDITKVLNATRKARRASKSEKKTDSAYKKGFASLAAIIKAKVPDAATEVDGIVSGIEAEVGAIVADPPSPSGEKDPPEAAAATASQDTTAEVGGNTASVGSATTQDESNVAPEVIDDINKQVEISAMTGLNRILKKTVNSVLKKD